MDPSDWDLWTCPECGHRFVTRNMWHSCGNYDLNDHFSGKDPLDRKVFDQMVDVVQTFGPVTVYAQKTRIVFQARTRFAVVVTRKRWLNSQVWLKRRIEHPLLQRVEMFTYRDYGHIFRLSSPADIDDAMINLLHESYALGSI